MKKIEALAKFLECEQDEILESRYDDNVFEYGREDYLVLTDSEADEAVNNTISESVWAFNASFLQAHIPDGISKAIIELVQTKCEEANEPLKAMIKNWSHFVSDAVSADGRGHFLAGYDGEENEIGEYFIYRIN